MLETRIDLVGLPDVLAAVLRAVRQRGRLTILYVNAHCMNVRQRDASYGRILDQAELVYCDGTGVSLGARLAGLEAPRRMTGADWIDPTAAFARDHGLSLFLLGGETGVAAEAGEILQARHPGLQIVGTASGFDLTAATVEAINQARADILLVGMGTPTQEKWIDAHRQEIEAPVVWAVGALFDFITGRIPRGPRWMTQHGLEWLCRLAAEPRKLWRRYLIGNPAFLYRVWRQR